MAETDQAPDPNRPSAAEEAVAAPAEADASGDARKRPPEPPGRGDPAGAAARAGRDQDAAAAGEASIPDASLEYWISLNDESREEALGLIDDYYDTLLEEFVASANAFVDEYKGHAKLSRRWRFWLIVLTGGLALLNVLATSWPDSTPDRYIRADISFAAAVYAVLLALATNVESFHNYADKQLSARDSRELFLDAYREFDMLRLTYVYPFKTTPQACFNLNALYRRLVAKDAELRRKLKQLTTTGGPAAAGQKPA